MTSPEAAIRKAVSFQQASDRNLQKARDASLKNDKNTEDDDPSFHTNNEDTRSTRSMGSSTSLLRRSASKSASMSMPESYRKQLYQGAALQPKFLFFPWSKWYKWWFGWTVVWSLLTVFFETYTIAFLPGGLSSPTDAASIVEYCFLIVFGVDILVNFNLAYTDREELVVTDRKLIVWNYFRCWFWIDLVGVFPFYITILAARNEIGVDNQQTRNLQLVRLLRLIRLHRVVHAFELTQYSTKISLMWYTMTRNFGGAIMWTHFAACMMFFIARQHDFQDSWLEQPADSETNFDLYVTSLYWSIVTFATGTSNHTRNNCVLTTDSHATILVGNGQLVMETFLLLVPRNKSLAW
jgi:Ion transport protein